MTNPNNADIEIVNRNDDGRGRGYLGDRVVLVAQTVPGDIVKVKIDKQTKNTVQGRVKKLVRASPQRESGDCPHEFVCTGCMLMGTSEEDELTYKVERVAGFLEKSVTVGDLEEKLQVERPSEALNYRYYAKQVFSVQNGRPILGAYIASTHDVADNSGCPVLAPSVRQAVDAVADEVFRRKLRIAWKGEPGLRYLTVRGSKASGEILISLVSSRALEGVWREELVLLAEGLLDRIDGVCGVVAIENMDKGNVLLKGEASVLAGRATVTEEMCGFQHEIGSQSFFQINPVSAAAMFETALEFAGEGELCLELFCGVGAMTLPLTRAFKKVIAVELSEESTAALSRALAQVPAESVRVEQGDAYQLGPDILRETGAKVLVADPPRRGLGAELIKSIADSSVQRLVFLSCQPAVLERDLPLLEKAGFKLSALSIVDQFPGTVHVETVALLERVQQ